MTMPTFIPELEFRAFFGFDDIGRGPFGARQVATIAEGKFIGERLSGTTVGAGADWLLLGEDGFGRLDVRATFKTDDGANIYVQYFGLLQMSDAIGRILAGAEESTEFGDQVFFVNPRMETGDERYAWVNHTVFLGQGRVLSGPRVEYVIYRVDN
jgi:hypothetical protein